MESLTGVASPFRVETIIRSEISEYGSMGFKLRDRLLTFNQSIKKEKQYLKNWKR